MAKAFVDIIEYDTEEVVSSIECNHSNPQKVERGVNINMNHDNYYTKIRYEDETE